MLLVYNCIVLIYLHNSVKLILHFIKISLIDLYMASNGTSIASLKQNCAS